MRWKVPLLSALIVGHVAFAAAAPKHEALLNSALGSTANFQAFGTGERVEMGLGYLFGLNDLVQLGAVIGGGYRGTEYLNVGVLAYLNLATDEKHSVFVGGGIGWNDATRATRAFSWQMDLGFRCPIVPQFFWRPFLSVTDDGGGPFIEAQFLALSLTY